jgi:predicted GNAT family N-acyltransferase
VQDERQADYFHAAILISGSVAAYGQLVPQDNSMYQNMYKICQMVVKPRYQGQNFGSRILLFLIEQAKQESAIAKRRRSLIALTLDARTTAVGFYQKFGFQTHGTQFPSATTGILHITMNKKL